MLDSKDTSALIAEADHAMHILILSLHELRSQLALMRIQHFYTMTIISKEMYILSNTARELAAYKSMRKTDWRPYREYNKPLFAWTISSTGDKTLT